MKPARTFGGPPPGWVMWCGELKPDPSVAGYVARGQQIRAHCRHQYCRRTCWIECERLAEEGMGGLRMEEAQKLWRCQRIGGCYMTFEDDRRGMLSLDELSRLPRVRARLCCKACKSQWEGPIKTVIARLKKAGEGDERTRCHQVDQVMRRPCGKCGKVYWQFSLRWKEG